MWVQVVAHPVYTNEEHNIQLVSVHDYQHKIMVCTANSITIFMLIEW